MKSKRKVLGTIVDKSGRKLLKVRARRKPPRARPKPRPMGFDPERFK